MSDDESNLPSAAECQKRVEQFAEITQTDEALAQFYLQDRDWHLQSSIEAYFAANPGVKMGHSASKDVLAQFSFITWNLDGLDGHNLAERTSSVAKTLKERLVDVVFLQEVIPSTYEALKAELGSQYLMTECNASNPKDYFTAVLLKRDTVRLESVQVLEYEGTLMMRDLTLVEAKISGKDFLFLNTHLESTGVSTLKSRIWQFWNRLLIWFVFWTGFR